MTLTVPSAALFTETPVSLQRLESQLALVTQATLTASLDQFDLSKLPGRMSVANELLEIAERPLTRRLDLDRRAAVLAREVTLRGMGDLVSEVRQFMPDGSAEFAQVEDLYRQLSARMVDETMLEGWETTRETILKGIAKGLTDQQIGESIHELGVTKLRAWANTWARTETTRFYNLGRLVAAEEAGDLVWGFRYDVIVDDRTTEICLGFVGYQVAKALLRFVPPLHWACRTPLVAVMPGWLTGQKEPETTLPFGVRPAEGFGDNPLTETAATATPLRPEVLALRRQPVTPVRPEPVPVLPLRPALPLRPNRLPSQITPFPALPARPTRVAPIEPPVEPAPPIPRGLVIDEPLPEWLGRQWRSFLRLLRRLVKEE